MWQFLALWMQMTPEVLKKVLDTYYDSLISCGHIKDNETENILIVIYLSELIEELNDSIDNEQLSCLNQMMNNAIRQSCILTKAHLLNL